MIRNGNARLGVVLGQGGSALDYNFDADGLSDDPRLPVYLQSLTPGQLQTALNPDPTGELTFQQFTASHDAYIAAGTNCDGTDCGANLPTSSIPTWAWIAGGAALLLLLLKR